MTDLILVSWVRAPWRWWRSLGGQLHEDVLTLCVLLLMGSVPLFKDSWSALFEWVWGVHGLGSSKEQLLTILTGALAIATYGLFRRTADLAERTSDAGRLADMHHQQSLSGLVVLSRGRVRFATTAPELYDSDPPHPILRLLGSLENVGGGPALGIRLILEHRASGSRTVHHIGSLYPGRPLDLWKGGGGPTVHVSNLPPVTEEFDVGPFLNVSVSWTNLFGGGQQARYFVTTQLMHLKARTPLKIMRRRLPTGEDIVDVPDRSTEREDPSDDQSDRPADGG